MSAPSPAAWLPVVYAAKFGRLVVTGSEPADYGEIQRDGSVIALSAHDARWVAALLLASCLRYERNGNQLLITTSELGDWFLVLASMDLADTNFGNGLLSRAAKDRPTEPQ